MPPPPRPPKQPLNPTMPPRPPPPLSFSTIHIAVNEAPRSPSSPPNTLLQTVTLSLRTQTEFLMTGVVPLHAQPGSECTTCLEPLASDVVQMARCGHVFHCTCILAWFQSSYGQRNRCPNCRAELYTSSELMTGHLRSQATSQPGMRGLQEEVAAVQRRIDEVSRRRDEAIRREVDEDVARRQRIDAILRRRSGDQADLMRQRGELNRQHQEFRLSQWDEAQGLLRLNETVEQLSRLPPYAPAILQASASGDNAPPSSGRVRRHTFASMPTTVIERFIQRTSIPESLRSQYKDELNRRRTEAMLAIAPGSNVGASTTVGAEGGGSSLRSHLVPPSGGRTNVPPDSRRPPPRPYNSDWLNQRLEAQRAETSSSRGDRDGRGQTSQLPHPRVETASRRGSSGFSTTTSASGPLSRPGLVQGIDRPGTPISPPEDSSEFGVAEPFTFSPASETDIRIQLPRQENPQLSDVHFGPGIGSLATDQWYGSFTSLRTPVPTGSNRPADIDVPTTRWPTSSQIPTANFASTELRDSIFSSQFQATALEIPRSNQEVREFLRQTDPSPTAGDDVGSVRGTTTGHERRGSFG
ncbi:hypothetical protein B5807_03211 [Epicoccum nigrum]|uniref:RING-type domain-containing protein n=1 Tax=Epicoccum nigrum TaxID=105696 RepID=A0A1Y2M886_EPING|nr:hypothetical protein B5807_03211 [Epicoccum nigrum]